MFLTFFWLVKEEFNIFSKEFYSALIYFFLNMSLWLVKENLSLSYSINKLCLWCVHFFVLLGLNVIVREDSFHAGNYFFPRFRIILCKPCCCILISMVEWFGWPNSVFFPLPLFVLDSFHIALQSTREITAAEMVHYSPWQGKEKDHPGNCSDYSLSWSEDKQFCWLEGAKTCL